MLRKTLMSLAVLLAACGGPAAEEDSTAAGGETSGEETASAGSAHDVCVTAMTRERECQEAFLPALVALRVRLDQPAGIAERAESEGQEALMSEASTEYAADSTDEFASPTSTMPLASRCEKIAVDMNYLLPRSIAGAGPISDFAPDQIQQ